MRAFAADSRDGARLIPRFRVPYEEGAPCLTKVMHVLERSWAAAVTLLGVLAIAAPASATAPRSKVERAFLVDMVGHHVEATACSGPTATA